MHFDELTDRAERVGALLRSRGERVGVAECSAGGLISAALLSVTGASAFYLGGAVAYTRASIDAFVAGPVETPPGFRGASEVFATHLARSVVVKLGATWGIGEGGAAGPANPYGDPAGHAWLAVTGPVERTRHVLTGLESRPENMFLFAAAALDLFAEVLEPG